MKKRYEEKDDEKIKAGREVWLDTNDDSTDEDVDAGEEEAEETSNDEQ
ncbi:MAG: hypothetical protein ACJ75F_03235 [Flavisolibacter sp.]|jgi:hypothetical protein